MLTPDSRRHLDGTSIAHLATVLPDGSPHSVPLWVGTRDPRVALSLAPAENPFEPVIIRGRVVEWLDHAAAREVIDQLSIKYTGHPYPPDEERVIAVIEVGRQTIGVG